MAVTCEALTEEITAYLAKGTLGTLGRMGSPRFKAKTEMLLSQLSEGRAALFGLAIGAVAEAVDTLAAKLDALYASRWPPGAGTAAAPPPPPTGAVEAAAEAAEAGAALAARRRRRPWSDSGRSWTSTMAS